MQRELIEANLAFLGRVQLSAQEIDAFTAVRNALIGLLDAPKAEAPVEGVVEVPETHELADK